MKKRVFWNFKDISECVTLVQIMETTGNVNHDVSITGSWIYDSNYRKEITLMRELLGVICSLFKYYNGIYA